MYLIGFVPSVLLQTLARERTPSLLPAFLWSCLFFGYLSKTSLTLSFALAFVCWMFPSIWSACTWVCRSSLSVVFPAASLALPRSSFPLPYISPLSESLIFSLLVLLCDGKLMVSCGGAHQIHPFRQREAGLGYPQALEAQFSLQCLP